MKYSKLFPFLWGMISFFLLTDVTLTEAKYPTKPLEMIVAYPAGGGQDVTFRILAKHAEKYLGERIVVINKVGGGGVIGQTEMARSKPDGYTLGTIATTMVCEEFIIKGVPYTHKDFIPVTHVASDPHALVIKNALKMNFKQFIEHAKKNPSKVSMAIGCNWCSHDFFRAKLEKIIGLKFLRMPYQGGAPAVQAVAGGHVDSSTPFISEALPQVEGKMVTAIVTSGAQRSPSLPDIPTVKEFGYDLVQMMWRGVSVPPGTPQEIVDFLNEIFTKAFNDPEFQKDLKKAGGSPSYKGHKEFVAYYMDEHRKYSALIKELGIEPK
jgi:tripartite-type tricarboxylate transporter receptor subunit TctC